MKGRTTRIMRYTLALLCGLLLSHAAQAGCSLSIATPTNNSLDLTQTQSNVVVENIHVNCTGPYQIGFENLHTDNGQSALAGPGGYVPYTINFPGNTSGAGDGSDIVSQPLLGPGYPVPYFSSVATPGGGATVPLSVNTAAQTHQAAGSYTDTITTTIQCTGSCP